MPKNYVTNWFKIATAGPTVDGRELKPEWLSDMAQTYDTAEYTARIWIDHFRFFGALGDVNSLKTETDEKDRICLFAKLRPNEFLLSHIKNDLDIFTSVEITENFAGTNSAYLTGLAVTDSPASLGTERLEFNHKGSQFTGQNFKTGCCIASHQLQQNTENGLFEKFKLWLNAGGDNDYEKKQSQKTGVFPMPQQKFTEQSDSDNNVADDQKQADAESAAADDNQKNVEAESAVAELKPADSVDHAAIFETFGKQLDELNKKIDDIDEKFSRVQGVETLGEHTGNANYHELY